MPLGESNAIRDDPIFRRQKSGTVDADPRTIAQGKSIFSPQAIFGDEMIRCGIALSHSGRDIRQRRFGPVAAGPGWDVIP